MCQCHHGAARSRGCTAGSGWGRETSRTRCGRAQACRHILACTTDSAPTPVRPPPQTAQPDGAAQLVHPEAGQKRPAEAEADASPASKAARSDPAPGAANGMGGGGEPGSGGGGTSASLEEQLAAALAEGARWKEESEAQRRRIEVLEGVVAASRQQQQEGGGGGADAQATIRSLQAQLAAARKEAEGLRAAGRESGQVRLGGWGWRTVRAHVQRVHSGAGTLRGARLLQGGSSVMGGCTQGRSQAALGSQGRFSEGGA